MRQRGCLYRFIPIFVMMAIVITMNIAYADSPSTQSDRDLPSSWAKAELDKAMAANLVPQTLQADYRQNITREEFSEIAVSLYEALGGQAVEVLGENPFKDTDNLKVRIANQLGIVNGVAKDRFAPDDTITRQEISVMLYRTLQAAKPNYDYSILSGHIFTDHTQISIWARESVSYLYGIEVVNGGGDNLFCPQENTTREQGMVLAERMYEKSLQSKGTMRVSRGGTSRQAAVTQAKLAVMITGEMGKPYEWGAVGPDSYDCSGLVYTLYGKLGILLPRVARDQGTAGGYIPKEELMYGDLVFFAKDGQNIHHVGIYIGEGMFVHAPESGDVVKKSTLMSGYYERCYYMARRVIN
jgi:cell wall-associated NlpC family hydrolase